MFASECVCAGAEHVHTQLNGFYYITHVVFSFRDGKNNHLPGFSTSRSYAAMFWFKWDDRIPQSRTCFVLVFTVIN